MGAVEIFGTAGLIILVLFIYTVGKIYFWPLVLKFWPQKPPESQIDPADLYDLKARERAFAQRQITNRNLRQEWQKDFDKLVKDLCRHTYDGRSTFYWDECTKCKERMYLYHTWNCTCEWDSVLEYTLGSGLHKEVRTRMRTRDRECPIHGVAALTKK